MLRQNKDNEIVILSAFELSAEENQKWQMMKAQIQQGLDDIAANRVIDGTLFFAEQKRTRQDW